MSGPTEGNLNSTTPAAPSGKQNVVFQADSAFTDPTTGLPERDVSAYPQSATSSLEGTVKLAQDLGGTAASPKVVGIQGTGVSTTSPTNGQVLQYASGSGLWVPTTLTGSGFGSAPFNSMLAPSMLTPPVLASLTWGNQGSTTAAANAGGALYVTAPKQASEVLSILYKSAPATPWTLVIGLVPGFSPNDYCIAGIAVRDSISGRLMALHVGSNNGAKGSSVWLAKYSSYTSFNADLINATGYYNGPVAWLSVNDDGTNLTWSVAIDGQNFKQIQQASRTSWLTNGPNQVGIDIDAIGSTYNPDAVFVHWAGI